MVKCHDDPLISDLSAAVSGYSIHQQSRSQRRGGGVAILAKSNLKLGDKKSHKFKSFECLEVTLRSQSALLRNVVVYRAPESKRNKATKSDFLSDFSCLLEEIMPLPGLLLIGGDFNFHMDDMKSHASEKFLDLLESRGLQQ